MLAAQAAGMLHPAVWAAAALLCIVVGTAACARLSPVETPEWKVPSESKPVVYTATDGIRALAVGRDGAIWAATEGGVMRWEGRQEPYIRRWTTADGLVSNDIRALMLREDGAVIVTSPSGENEITSEGAVVPRDADERQAITAATVGRTKQAILTATAAEGLFYTPAGGKRKPIPLPAASRASHVSALAVLNAEKQEFLAGLYGDGVYRVRFSGKGRMAEWRRLTTPDD
ncbi:MAG: hypothetical protein H8F28_07945, partial [Fibrella sp.]|nr:hypothetical protein [Armatimonadota bacterium]